MIIDLFKNSSETNHVNKSSYLLPVVSYTGTLKAQTSIINPTILIECNYNEFNKDNNPIVDDDSLDVIDGDGLDTVYSIDGYTFLDCNYAYIEDLKRYYFIIDIQPFTDKLWVIDLKCDVLMSFKENILSLKAYIERNEFDYNLDLVDEFLNYKQNLDVTFEEFATPLFDNEITWASFSYVASIVGGF